MLGRVARRGVQGSSLPPCSPGGDADKPTHPALGSLKAFSLEECGDVANTSCGPSAIGSAGDLGWLLVSPVHLTGSHSGRSK